MMQNLLALLLPMELENKNCIRSIAHCMLEFLHGKPSKSN